MSKNELSERKAAAIVSLILTTLGLALMVYHLGWGSLGVFLFVWGYGVSLMRDIWWPKKEEKQDVGFHP